jgi:hypothetical protein
MSVPPNPDFASVPDRADAMPADPEPAAPADGTLPPRPASPTVDYVSAGPPDTATLPPSLRVATPALASVHLPGYEILGELGRGGMGVVYKARQVGLNRLVALKMILAGGHASAGELDRFRTEGKAVARLQHPNVVAIHEVGEQNGLPYFSLEYCEGGSLAARLHGTPWEPAKAAALVETLALAMQAAHERGIIHRDLKPANILLAEDGTPKITDFGLAKQLDSAAGRTATGAILGTPSYMAPEQAAGAKEIGPAADVYALGAVLYELLTGRPPFRAGTDFDTMMQVLEREPVPPTRLNPSVPRDLETICLRCLEKEPARRYDSAVALAEELGRFRAGEPILARPPGPVERLNRWVARNQWLTLTCLGALVALCILVTFFDLFLPGVYGFVGLNSTCLWVAVLPAVALTLTAALAADARVFGLTAAVVGIAVAGARATSFGARLFPADQPWPIYAATLAGLVGAVVGVLRHNWRAAIFGLIPGLIVCGGAGWYFKDSAQPLFAGAVHGLSLGFFCRVVAWGLQRPRAPVVLGGLVGAVAGLLLADQYAPRLFADLQRLSPGVWNRFTLSLYAEVAWAYGGALLLGLLSPPVRRPSADLQG